MNKLLKTQKGFTVVELLVGLAVSGIVMAGIVGVLAASAKVEADATQRAACVQSARSALTIITDELQDADTITSPTDPLTFAENITFTKNGVTTEIVQVKNGIQITTGTQHRTVQIAGLQPFIFKLDAIDPRIITVKISVKSGKKAEYSLRANVVALNNI
jgi:prepilin-type N-terminal cleavage/methylation domain-containing protein